MIETPPSTVAMLRGLLQEVADYGRDLARLFAAELREQSRTIRYVGMLAAGAALLLLVSFLLLTAALVGVIAYGLDSWRWSVLIVGVAYGLIGLISLAPLASALHRGLFRFDHTRRRLRDDALFVKHEFAADVHRDESRAA